MVAMEWETTMWWLGVMGGVNRFGCWWFNCCICGLSKIGLVVVAENDDDCGGGGG